MTCSDSRDESTDQSGRWIVEQLQKNDHRVSGYGIVPDDAEPIRERLLAAIGDGQTQVVILNGGTGISPRDGTFEVVDGLLDKRIDGFGELFRMLSYGEIGSSAMLSRAVAGVSGRCLLISLPGSLPAVQLAMNQLILPELRHMVWLLQPAKGS